MRLQNMRIQTTRYQVDDVPSLDSTASLPLQVEARDGLPVQVLWRNRPYQVTCVLEVSCVQGRWWLDWKARGVLRRTFRVVLDNGHGHCFGAEVTQQNANWKLSKILD